MTSPTGTGDDDGITGGDVAGAIAGGIIAAGGGSPAAVNGVAGSVQATASDVGAMAGQAVGWGQSAVKGLDPTAAIAAGLGAMTAPLMEFGKLADWVFKLSLPTTWIRVCAWIGAAFFLTFGIILLARELRTK